MEREPKEQEPVSIQLRVGEWQFTMPEGSGNAWTFKEAKYDHIGITLAKSDKETEDGEFMPSHMVFIFRDMLGSDFDDVLEVMRENDYFVHEELDDSGLPTSKPGRLDKQMYQLYKTHKKPVELLLEGDEYRVQPFGGKQSTELVHVPQKEYDLPYPEEKWGASKLAHAIHEGEFVAYLLEQIANGEREE